MDFYHGQVDERSWYGFWDFGDIMHNYDFGRHEWGAGKQVQVEFVSANPTGPLHVGNGWWASYGDALCRLLEATGAATDKAFSPAERSGSVSADAARPKTPFEAL